MKSPRRTTQKLALRKDTLRILTRLDLTAVIGGNPTSTVLVTGCECASVDACTELC